ncbi:MAG: ABC transporter permease [Bacteroidia bacterium]|nr:MAG: ABC transporter permease [Bacteroidia bacterium]
MKKIVLVIGFEIKRKVTNKVFILMTFLTPLIIAGFVALMFWLSMEEETEYNVLVADESQFFIGKLQGNNYATFLYSNISLNKCLDKLNQEDVDVVLYIPHNIIEGAGGTVKVFYKKTPGLAFQTMIKSQLEKLLFEHKLLANNINPSTISSARQNVRIVTEKVNEKGEHAEQITAFNSLLGFLSAFLMFMFITMYGMMLFKSVIEEKTNRVVEVIVSSIRPFQLLMGKILGIAILGIGQFIVMSIMTFVLVSVISVTLMSGVREDYQKFLKQQKEVYEKGVEVNFNQLENFQGELEAFELLKQIDKLNFFEITICFILYFIGGYLFYSAMLAALGSAADAETDAQQFTLPVTLFLMVGYFIAAKMMTNPDTSLSYWTSFIPFTSPIVMMARLPFGVPLWELILSIGLLYLSFFLMTKLSAKIYRTGILMYGKKASWKEIFRWMFS